MKSRNPLERICRVAEKEKLAVRVHLGVNRGRALVERYPHAACVNIFGDQSTFCLCPRHPDVQQYASGLVTDLLKNYPIDEVELTGFAFPTQFELFDEYEFDFDLFNDLRDAIACFCFCSSCWQGMTDKGGNLELIRNMLLDAIKTVLADNSRPLLDRGGVLFQSPEIVDFCAFRKQSEMSLLKVATSPAPSKSRLRLYRREKDEVTIDDAIMRIANGIAFFVPYDNDYDSEMNARMASVGGPSHCMGIHSLWSVNDGPLIVKEVQNSMLAGFGGIAFDHYGSAHEPWLDWVRQAIRFARREAR